ncbi:MAG: hypothetical protein ACLFWF_09830 [Alphaproteobacteria bacterium]
MKPAEAASGRTGTGYISPVLVLNMRSYRWELPEFRMAGKQAYALVEVENTHDHPLKMRVNCRTSDGPVPDMNGFYTIPPRQFLRIDTRRKPDALQRGEGVKVKCRFRADGSAKVKAWVYDVRTAGRSPAS